jgi:adenylate kinase
MKRLILFGAPGSGKGTMGDLIARDFGYPKISTGDILRAEIEQGSAAGLRAKGFMESGGLVPDELVSEMVRRRLGRDDLAGGYVLDGYPRTLAQAQALSQQPCDREQAIFIEVDEAEAVTRLLSRLTCSACGAIYNQRNKPPRRAGLCDLCGGSVGRRSDDNEQAVRQRLHVYAERTLPVIAYYQERGVLARIDGNGPAAPVYERIRGVLA